MWGLEEKLYQLILCASFSVARQKGVAGPSPFVLHPLLGPFLVLGALLRRAARNLFAAFLFIKKESAL